MYAHKNTKKAHALVYFFYRTLLFIYFFALEGQLTLSPDQRWRKSFILLVYIYANKILIIKSHFIFSYLYVYNLRPKSHYVVTKSYFY